MRAADRTCAAAGAEAAVSGLPGPRVVVTVTNALLRVVFQRLGSRGLEGVAAWQSPWKRVHFRRAVTSVSFMQASLPASFLSPFSGLRLWKAALLWYRVVFGGFFCFFGFVCSVSQDSSEACFWNPLSWVSPPNGGPRTAVRGADLCAAPQGPFRPWQAWYTISMLV